ncbi:MAG: transcription termination factor Rho [Acidimicrobiales bacterium]
MAIKPSPDRSDLESKTREDLQTIAKLKGVDTPARATKAALIEAIMGDAPITSGSASEVPSRAVRSRRTVATPTDDFEELLGEFVADAKADPASAPAPTAAETNGGEVAPSERPVARQFTQARPERQPREFSGESNNRSRRNRRNRNGRERFGGEAMPNADQPYAGELVEVEGLLDLRDDGYGFLRTKGYHSSPNDVYVSINQVRRYHLRKGDTIVGGFRPAASNEKYPALLRVDSVAGIDPEVARLRPRFEDLTPLFPDEKLNLETNEGKLDLTPRIVDLLAPIGKGQRGLIVSPPKAGKTTIMKQIAQSIETNNPEVHLMVLLVDERPEEVTDIRRSVKGEVISSTFDRPAEEHTHVAELCIERAKRLVEQGRDVVIILDGITRLARAYNLAAPATGRIMSGGVDSGALYPPKKFFGAARNIEEGGSLTILASALVETGSKMDEVIFEEFKGTGNMELRLDRRLAERRLYPAIDVNGSSTRHEELLFGRDVLPQVWKLRRVLNGLSAEGRDAAGLELLIDKLKTTKSNDEFLAEIARGPAPTS